MNKPVVDQKIEFGRFEKSFDEINFLEVDKPFGSNFFKNSKLKEWNAFQVGNKHFFILIAIYNAKFLGVIQFLIYDKINKKKYFYKKNVIPTKLTVPNSINNSFAEFKSNNFFIRAEYVSNKLKISAFAKNNKKLPDFKADFEADLSEKPPQVACIPFKINAGMYSQKSAVNVSGKLTIGSDIFDFIKSDSFLIFDDHKGFYPNPMIYDWCTGAKTDKENFVAFNLTDNQSINSDKFNENCIWVNNKIHYLPAVKFTRSNNNKEWIIKDKNGLVDLKFFPKVENNLIFNLLIIKSDYQGPFGYFKGFIKINDNDKIILDDVFGMGEKKFIRG
ncbi:MAG: DUF2804 domain-containing protein [Bacteroidales bacterium]|nr:DUF2804 domain-containing protein [Bacteroidales bacterium]